MTLPDPVRRELDLEVLKGTPTALIKERYGVDAAYIRVRRHRLLKANGNGGNGHETTAISPVSNGETAMAPRDGNSQTQRPVTARDVEAELGKLLNSYEDIEADLRRRGSEAIPGVLACMGERRKTLETLLKSRELGAALRNAQEPEDWREEALAWLDRFLDKAPVEYAPIILKMASEVDPP
jgi:hypothetical protein